MKFASSVLLAVASATVATAQATYNSTTDSWYCPVANGTYCAQESLTGSMIVLCVNGVGMTGDCSGHIQSRPPIDLFDAQCWQVSADAGNATCSKNCTVYPDEGYPYNVSGSCNYSMPSYGSNIPGYGFMGANSTGNSTTSGNTSVASHTPTAPLQPSSTASKSKNAAPAPTAFLATGSSIVGLAVAMAIAL